MRAYIVKVLSGKYALGKRSIFGKWKYKDFSDGVWYERLYAGSEFNSVEELEQHMKYPIVIKRVG